MLHFESAMIFALLVIVTAMMYHLNLTLKLIFDKEEHISIEKVRIKEKNAIIMGITLASINCCTRFISNFFMYTGKKCMENRIASMVDEIIEMICILTLFLIYVVIISSLYRKVKNLEHMAEERRAIVI